MIVSSYPFPLLLLKPDNCILRLRHYSMERTKGDCHGKNAKAVHGRAEGGDSPGTSDRPGTYATLAAPMVGSNVWLLSDMLGHSKIDTTRIYCHAKAPAVPIPLGLTYDPDGYNGGYNAAKVVDVSGA